MLDLATLLLTMLVQTGVCTPVGFGGPTGIIIYTCVGPVPQPAATAPAPKKPEFQAPRFEMQAGL